MPYRPRESGGYEKCSRVRALQVYSKTRLKSIYSKYLLTSQHTFGNIILSFRDINNSYWELSYLQRREVLRFQFSFLIAVCFIKYHLPFFSTCEQRCITAYYTLQIREGQIQDLKQGLRLSLLLSSHSFVHHRFTPQ